MFQHSPSISSSAKPTVLCLIGCYLPGFGSGGPVRTISCMVEALAPSFNWKLVALNHDSGSTETYSSVQTGQWNVVGSGEVFYVPRWSLRTIQRLTREVRPDVLYLNGFFSTSSVYALLARRLGMLPDIPVVLATRGDLAEGALGLKAAKKRIYMRLARLLGLYSGLVWHASSEREKAEMLRQFEQVGVAPEIIHVAPDLGFGYDMRPAAKPDKHPGSANFVTLSRIVRMKNPLFMLDRIGELRGEISLDIFGPCHDANLRRECDLKIASLPANIRVRFLGPLAPERVIDELSQRHFFILPTLGENYGHSIIEGAAAGCPVVISDRTQWLGLERKGAGWDIPLESVERWREVLQGCVDMPGEGYRVLSEKAASFGRSVMNSRDNLQENIELFRRSVSPLRTDQANQSRAG